MAPLTPDWQRALSLLDAGLTLPAEQREAWLDQMAAKEPGALPLLRKLLAAHGRVQTHEILATLPKVIRGPKTVDSGAAGLHVGPFELLEPLGRGGMGSVWRARYADARLKRDVAVKLPASTDDPVALRTLRERFARERDFLAQLQHPHIARLYDAGVSDNGQPFLAMEYVAGTAIDTYCDEKRLPVKARLQLFLQVLDAVAYAHQQLVLHRDLKAGNVLVDNKGQVRLLDFGVARLLPPPEVPQADVAGAVEAAGGAAAARPDDVNGSAGVRAGTAEPAAAPTAIRAGEGTDLTERAGAAFTLGHAAPEQISHGALSTATDVYALGVMLYRLLTGLPPYQPSRDTRGALEDAVLLATPAAASSRDFSLQALQARGCEAAALRKGLQGDVDVILAKALKKNPAERYATVTALADDLRRHLAQQPIIARPDSWWYRSSRFVARNRVAVAATVLASVALVGTAGVAGWQALVSARNAELAQKEAARANTAQKFFAGLMSNADPEKNRNITAVDRHVLDQAMARAEQDFAESPETLALVLKQMGEIYFRIGNPGRYLDVQRKRVALATSSRELVPDEVVDAHIELGTALGQSIHAAERAQAMHQLLAAYQMALSLGAGDVIIVRALSRIADQNVAESNYVTADRYAGLALQHALDTLKSPHPLLSYAYVQQGVTATRLGRFEAARQAYRAAMAIDATGAGRGTVLQIGTRLSLANTEYLAGQYRSAKRESLAALDFAATQLGSTEGTLAPIRFRAVLSAERAGDLEEAWSMVNRLLLVDLRSADPQQAGVAHFAKGVVALARRDLPAAAEAFETARVGISADPRARRSLLALVGILKLRSGQAHSVHELLAPALEQIRQESGTSSEEYAKVAEPMAIALARAGDLERAAALFEEGCIWRRATLPAEHPNRIRCESYLRLASHQFPGPDAQRDLSRFLEILMQRDDKMALRDSLRTALAALAEIKQGRTGAFPILD